MFCVATLGPGSTSEGEEPLRDQCGGLPGAPGPLGVDSGPGRDGASEEAAELACTYGPLWAWRWTRGAKRTCRGGKA